MTIGELLDELGKANPESIIYFDFCRASPTSIISSRCSYDEAAIGFEFTDSVVDRTQVKHVIDNINEVLSGMTFHGYKGGEYTYNRSTPLHVDNYSDCTNTELVSVTIEDYGYVYLNTRREEL